MPRLRNQKLYCSVCSLYVRNNQKGILCELCNVWYHARCVDVLPAEYERLSNCDDYWYCSDCVNNIFPFASASDDELAKEISISVKQHLHLKDLNLYSSNRFLSICSKLTEHNINSLHECNYYLLNTFNELEFDSPDNLILCFHLNCRGLCSKFDSLVTLFSLMHYKPDIIALSETWLSPGQESCLQLEEYLMLSKPGSNRIGGGVALYFCSKYESVPCDYTTHNVTFEHVETVLKFESQILAVVAVVYRPPHTNITVFLSEFEAYLTYLLALNKKLSAPLVLSGDFNINLLHIDSNSKVQDFADIVYSNFMFPSIYGPTRLTSTTASLIDNIFVTDPHIKLSGLLTVDISDHLPIFCYPNQPKSKLLTKHTKVYDIITSKTNFRKVCAELSLCSWDFVSDVSDVNTDYNKLLDIVRNAINLHTKTKLVKSKSKSTQPWITRGLLTSIKKKHKLYKQVLKNKCSILDYKSYKNKLTSLLRIAKCQYFSHFATEHKKDARSMWSLINSCIGKKPHNSSTLTNIEASTLNDYFVEAGPNAVKNLESNVSFNFYMKNNRVLPSMFWSPVTQEEVLKCVSSLAAKHSRGFDDLSVFMLKKVISHIILPLR
jgi:exonuclease III